MNKKSLIYTNKHLRDRIKRRKLIERSVITSCGVEGIVVDLSKGHWITK